MPDGNDATVCLPPSEDAEEEVVPMLVIGSGRASLTFLSHIPDRALKGVTVVDPTGLWLETWGQRHARMGTRFLRQAVTQTPFLDACGLESFIASRGDRDEDSIAPPSELEGGVRRPSFAVFSKFCASRFKARADRFGRARVLADEVTRLEIVPPEDVGDRGGGPLLRATLKSGKTLLARQVVHAGRWRAPLEPGWMLEARLNAASVPAATRDALAVLADVDVRAADVEGRDVLVVGGGEGAFTLAASAWERGAARVTLVSRDVVRRREREFPIEFFGNKGVGAFRAAAAPEIRLEKLREATGRRASVSQHAWSRLVEAEARRDGAAPRVIERREVERAEPTEDGARWRVVFAPPDDAAGSGAPGDDPSLGAHDWAAGESTTEADFVWAACGDVVDASRDPALQHLLESPGGARVVGGLPVLVEPNASEKNPSKAAASPSSLGALRWPGAPLYFVGAYAALSIGPVASSPAGHAMATRAVAAAVKPHAMACRRKENPYAPGLSPEQMQGPPRVDDDARVDESGVPLVLRRVPKALRDQRLMDDRQLAARDGGELTKVELSKYQIIEEDFVIEVRMKLPEAVEKERVRVAFAEQSVEVWATGRDAAYRFFVPKLYKPVIVERCRYESKGKRISVFLHKYEDQPWRFLKG